MTKTPLFPITLFVPILIFLLISGCGHGNNNPTNQPPTLISIAVSPAARSIPLGATRQFGVTGTYSDGSQQSVQASLVAWNSTNTGVMNISAGGAAISNTMGTTTISATYGGVTAAIPIQVTPTDIFAIWSTNVKPVDPVGVAVDSSSNVYVADAAIFSNNSSLIRKFSSLGIQAGKGSTTLTSNVVGGVAVDNISGNVYVTDYDKNLLNIYNPLGTPLTPFVTTAPAGVAVDSHGNVYVTDAANNYLYIYNSSGALITSWSTTGVPSGVAVDASGNVYVADFSGRMIWKYASDGTYKTKWSTTGTPSGVAVDPTGTKVYVVDTYYYMLREYDSGGNSLNGPWSTTGWPNAVAVDPSGYVYVVDATNNKVLRCPPQ
ncbi:MAG: Ig-like domain-containing protein [Oryzomonas sp.]|uniref:Ig-like domain-containing protein n=1 Tax=Oryzomonas sp. TaxID=2855186 RepID=UPI0028505A52|nr:Ig-like domain-containing protein [Oryzomonas sp.]MDR3579884.1 Ig-like domain-containing protein [Oryzomonas sp.]